MSEEFEEFDESGSSNAPIFPPTRLEGELGDNPLLKYQSVTYNITLTMMPVGEKRLHHKKRSFKHTDGITIIDSSRVGSVVMESLEIKTASPGQNNSIYYLSSIDHTFTAKVIEPLGGKLIEMIAKSAKAFNYSNTAEAIYLLEISFKGHENDEPVQAKDRNGSPLNFKWYVTITTLKMSIDVRGASYDLTMVNNVGAAQSSQYLKIETGVKVDADNDKGSEQNCGGVVSRLESAMNKYQKNLVKEGTIEFPDKYTFVTDTTIASLGFDFGSSKIKKNESWIATAVWTDGTISIPPGSTVQSYIHMMFGNSKPLINFLTNDAYPQGKVDPKPKSLEKLKKTILIVTDAVPQVGKYDRKRNRDAVDITIFVGYRVNPGPLISPIELLETASIDSVGARLDDYIKSGMIRKAYKWIYTGENTEILNLDLKLDNLWRVPLPVLPGVTSPPAKRSKNVISVNDKVAPSAALVPGRTEFIFAETLTDKEAGLVNDEINRYPPQFMPSNTKANEKTTQNENDEKDYYVKAIFKQLHSGASNTGDLLKIELEVIGDPFWLHQAPAGVGPPETDNVEWYIEHNGNIKESIIEITKKTATHNVSNAIYLDIQVPSSSRDNHEDLMDLNDDDVITGVYHIWSATHTFTGGKFTTKLSANKDDLLGQKAKEAAALKTRVAKALNLATGDPANVAKEKNKGKK
jgi:hypothetical protein